MRMPAAHKDKRAAYARLSAWVAYALERVCGDLSLLLLPCVEPNLARKGHGCLTLLLIAVGLQGYSL